MGTTSFNLAEQFQTVVFVLSDLDLGMNTWMSEVFDYPEEPINRGKVLTAEEVEEKGFARYKDIDGDGIGYRTLPGTKSPKAAYFTVVPAEMLQRSIQSGQKARDNGSLDAQIRHSS